MRILFLIVITVLLLPFNAYAEKQYCPTIKVCFTPGQNCTGEIVDAINSAQHTILMQAYSFTSAPIAQALAKAKTRGINVKVILDKSQHTQRYSSARYLRNQGIDTWIDYKPAIAHNKIIIIDNAKVITGSFNFTKAAQFKNAENVLLIDDRDLAKQYANNWQRRNEESIKLNGQENLSEELYSSNKRRSR